MLVISKYYTYLSQMLGLLYSLSSQFQNVVKSCTSGLHSEITLLDTILCIQDLRTSTGRVQ